MSYLYRRTIYPMMMMMMMMIMMISDVVCFCDIMRRKFDDVCRPVVSKQRLHTAICYDCDNFTD